MPNKESDPNGNAKKAHIGNDYVTIVYNESGEEYNIQTVKVITLRDEMIFKIVIAITRNFFFKFLQGQFNYANVIIQPLDHATNKVVVKVRDELADQIGHSEQKIVSDQNLAILARQLALHANVQFFFIVNFLSLENRKLNLLLLHFFASFQLASLVSRSLKTQNQDPYASNWLERLRKIKRLRQKVLSEISEENPDHKEFLSSSKTRKVDYMDDFTEYT